MQVFLSIVCQLVILLYLLENDTSWIILLSAAVGLFVESWKLTRAVHIKVDYRS